MWGSDSAFLSGENRALPGTLKREGVLGELSCLHCQGPWNRTRRGPHIPTSECSSGRQKVTPRPAF